MSEENLARRIEYPTSLRTEYTRNKDIFYFLGQPMLKGTFTDLLPDQLESKKPVSFYSHPRGEIWVGDAIYSTLFWAQEPPAL